MGALAYKFQYPPVKVVKSSKDLNEILQTEGRNMGVVVEFFAKRCDKCTDMTQAVIGVRYLYANDTDLPFFVKVDALNYRDIKLEFNITAYPTLRYYEISHNENRTEEWQWEEFPNDGHPTSRKIKTWLDGECGLEMSIHRGDLPPRPTPVPVVDELKDLNDDLSKVGLGCEKLRIEKCANATRASNITEEYPSDTSNSTLLSVLPEDQADDIPVPNLNPTDEEREANLQLRLEGVPAVLTP